jgi:RimJ/RimL family protein N-acetyltransferase
LKTPFSIESERLRLIEAKEENANFIIDLTNQEGWIKYIGDRNIRDETAALHYISQLHESYLKNGFGLWIVLLKDLNLPIGICGFLQREYLEVPDIGFAFLSGHEGQGYAIEAARHCINYGFAKLGLSTVHAITTPDNERSQRLLKKLGMTLTKTLEEQNGVHLYTLHHI